MNIQQMKIRIDRARFFARHGVLEQERLTGTHFYVTLEADVDFSQSMLTDKLSDTVSYADLFEIIRREMEIPSRLIEHLGGRILNHIFHAYPEITGARIEITKENPPMGADCQGAGIIITASPDRNV